MRPGWFPTQRLPTNYASYFVWLQTVSNRLLSKVWNASALELYSHIRLTSYCHALKAVFHARCLSSWGTEPPTSAGRYPASGQGEGT